MKKNHFVILVLVLISLVGLVMGPIGRRPARRGSFPTGFRAELLADQSSIGAKLFTKTCTQCHDLPSPKLHAPQEWPAVVDRMLEMLHRRKVMSSDELFIPDNEEADHIASYLVFHGENKNHPLLVDSSPAAVLYRDRCAECHLLPHPIQHTVSEWDGIVDRMQNYSRKTGKTPLTDDNKKTLLGYLKEKARS